MRNKNAFLSAARSGINGMRVVRGRITALSAELGILVENTDGASIVCDLLKTASAPPTLSVGDAVLFIRGRGDDRGCVLGVIEKYAAASASPEQVTINARERIELRVGQSSLTLNKNGRVTVKGEEVVSRATGVNKIRGAAVKIN